MTNSLTCVKFDNVIKVSLTYQKWGVHYKSTIEQFDRVLWMCFTYSNSICSSTVLEWNSEVRLWSIVPTVITTLWSTSETQERKKQTDLPDWITRISCHQSNKVYGKVLLKLDLIRDSKNKKMFNNGQQRPYLTVS